MKGRIVQILILLSITNFLMAQSKSKISQKRFDLAATISGEKLFIAGGQTFTGLSSVVDIYNLKTKSWSTNNLTHPRNSMQAVSQYGKVFFVGSSGITAHSNALDIYDDANDQWTSIKIPNAMYAKALAVYNDELLIGGNKNIDIYNIQNNEWKTKVLSQPRSGMCAVSSSKSIYFAGGYDDDTRYSTVDIYTPSLNKWETKNLSTPRSALSCVHFNNKVYFAAGVLINYKPTDIIDVYDEINNSWSVMKLPEKKFDLKAELYKEELYFIGGTAPGDFNNIYFKKIDIFNPKTNTWRFIDFEDPVVKFASATSKDTLFIAGGRNNTKEFDVVYFYHENISATSNDDDSSESVLYPNPVNDILKLNITSDFTNGEFDVYDIVGNKMVVTQEKIGDSIIFDCTHLCKGNYLIKQRKGNLKWKFIKI